MQILKATIYIIITILILWVCADIQDMNTCSIQPMTPLLNGGRIFIVLPIVGVLLSGVVVVTYLNGRVKDTKKEVETLNEKMR